MADSSRILEALSDVLAARREADPDTSYVAGLLARGNEGICPKITEEAAEVVEAAQEHDNAQLTHEVADLWFHSMVLLTHHGLGPDAVLSELASRFGTSGLTEKANRRA
jgi:phosphoribosyl-ATP pyrophosphohydrolase